MSLPLLSERGKRWMKQNRARMMKLLLTEKLNAARKRKRAAVLISVATLEMLIDTLEEDHPSQLT